MVILKEIEDEPPAPVNEPVLTTTDRIRIFRRSYAHILINSKVNDFCSECLKKPQVIGKLMTCTACNLARYCSKECQKMAWRLHKHECGRLQKSFPNLPLTEVMFLSRILDVKHAIEENGDRLGVEEERPLSSLIGHQDKFRADPDRLERFKKLFIKLTTFRKEELSGDEVFDIYCRASVNAITIQSMQGEEVGLSLDTGVSKYDHSCRPNCSMMFEGYYVFVRPLTPDVDPSDYDKCKISYTDIGRSRFQRRKELKAKWFFDCRCERCLDPTDDILTSIRCKSVLCDEPLLISEDMEPMPVTCPKCQTVADVEYVIRGQQTMLELPVRYSADAKLEELKGHLERARPILHEKNVYLNRLETAILHFGGKLGDNVASLYSKIQQNFSACFPTTDAAKNYGLVEKCAELIRSGRRSDATAVAFDAMCLLEASHGLAHPNYLRVLALWTFLEKKLDKTDEELLALCQMESGSTVKAVDLTGLLGNMETPAK